MNRTAKKFLLSFAITFCFLANIYAEDWIPNIFDNHKFEKANNTVKEYIIKNGTYLSGTKDFSFYYLNNVSISSDSIKPVENRKFVFSIVYKNKAYYFESFNRYDLGIMNYSIISTTPPIIYLKFYSGIGLDTVMISYDGSDFLINGIDCISERFDTENPGRYNELMAIPLKYSYLQGRKILKQDFADVSYVFSDDKEKIYDVNSHYRFWLLGIDSARSVHEVYYQTILTDDNLPLRTSNSKNANTITLLKKGSQVRIINIDPLINQMEGKNGFWVLIETEEGYIGWIRSNYLKDFSYETTRHFKDREPLKTW